MSGPRFTATYTGDHEVLDKGRWTATFEYLADAEAYVAWRNNPPTEAKFKVGDRVIGTGHPHWRGEVESFSVSAASTTFFVRWETTASEHYSATGVYHESDLELAPPEPPRKRWVVSRIFSPPNDKWRVWRDEEWAGDLYSEHVAQAVCDLLNAEQAQ